jgi:hypothetical protein
VNGLDDGSWSAVRISQGRRHVADGARGAAPHVVGAQGARAADDTRTGDRRKRRNRGGGDVTHVDEVPVLGPVLEDRGARPASRAERKNDATPAYGVSRGIPGPYTL